MLKISEKDELSALHKVMLEGKFRLDPFSEEISGSATVADLSNRIYDELCRFDEKNVPEQARTDAQKKLLSEDWQEWRRIRFTAGEKKGSYRSYRNFALMNARKDKMFADASEEHRRALVKCYLSPFTCTESEIDEFLSDLDGKTSGGKQIKELFKKHDLKGAMLIRAVFYDETSAQVSLMDLMHGAKTYDIFFSGVTSFEIKTEGEPGDDTLMLTKYSVSSEKSQKLELYFAGEKMKKTVRVTAQYAFC